MKEQPKLNYTGRKGRGLGGGLIIIGSKKKV